MGSQCLETLLVAVPEGRYWQLEALEAFLVVTSEGVGMGELLLGLIGRGYSKHPVMHWTAHATKNLPVLTSTVEKPWARQRRRKLPTPKCQGSLENNYETQEVWVCHPFPFSF